MSQLDASIRFSSTTELILSVVVDGDYYGELSAAVPFKWESHPGTPRRIFSRFDSDSDFNSPLTPPPSYFYSSPCSTKPVNSKKINTLFGFLLPKNRSSPSSPASSSSSSSSSMMASELCTRRNRRRSMWFESGLNHYNNAKSSGCYASIVKVLLRDVK